MATAYRKVSFGNIGTGTHKDGIEETNFLNVGNQGVERSRVLLIRIPRRLINEIERRFVFIVAGLWFAPAAALLCGAVLPTTSLCLGVSPSQRQATDFGGNEVLA